jgi:hypothetical protein
MQQKLPSWTVTSNGQQRAKAKKLRWANQADEKPSQKHVKCWIIMWTLWNKVKRSSKLVVRVPPFCSILCFIGGWCWCGIGGIPQHFLDTCISFCWKNILVFSDRCTSVLQMQWLGEVVSNLDLLIYCFSIRSEQKIVGNLPPQGP